MSPVGDWEEFGRQYESAVDKVFDSNPHLYDHRTKFPWLTGNLGDPRSRIWFAAENPSLSQVERVRNPDGQTPTVEAQWFASAGDKLFRENLVATGFKSGSWNSLGGWHCYITNVIKESDYAERWKLRRSSDRKDAAVLWQPVFELELLLTKPKLIVVLGNEVESHLKKLKENLRVGLPPVVKIPHYSYIAHRADAKRRLGPMHPLRIEEYQEKFSEIKLLFKRLRVAT